MTVTKTYTDFKKTQTYFPAVGRPELDLSQNSQGESIWTERPFLYIQQAFPTRHMPTSSRETEQITPLQHLMEHFYCAQAATSPFHFASSGGSLREMSSKSDNRRVFRFKHQRYSVRDTHTIIKTHARVAGGNTKKKKKSSVVSSTGVSLKNIVCRGNKMIKRAAGGSEMNTVLVLWATWC